MKWLGQHIWDFISRFRTTVYLENLETSSDENVLVVDSDGKVTKNTTLGGADLTYNGSTANGVLTYGSASTIDVESTFTYDSSINLLDLSSSSGGTLPFFKLSNSHTGAAGPGIQFVKSADGDADDILGKVTWLGDDDDGNTQTYAELKATIKDATAGSEAGILELQVAENDGTVTTGLKLEGQPSDDGEIDITIGAGAASTTTIAGNLDIDGASVTSAGNLTITQGNSIVIGSSGTAELLGSTVTLDSAANIELEVGGGTNYINTEGIFRGSNIGTISDSRISVSPTQFLASSYRFHPQYVIAQGGINTANAGSPCYAEVVVPAGYTATSCTMYAADVDNDGTIRCYAGSVIGNLSSAVASADTFSSGSVVHDFGSNDIVGNGSNTVIIEWTAGDALTDILHGGFITIEKTT